MVDNTKAKTVSRKTTKIQGTSGLDILVIIIVVITVFAFLATILFAPAAPDTATNTSTVARSTTVSSSNAYPYSQPTTTYVQPTYTQPTYAQPGSIQSGYSQNTIQGRAAFSNNSVAGDINATTGVVAGTTGAAVVSSGVANAGIVQQNTTAYGISNGEVIGLNPIQPLATPYIPTTVPNATVTGRAALTPGSNPAAPYVANNSAIYIDSVQSYHPQNQELTMDQACVNEVWQRNPYVIRNFSNLSVRLSATNPTANGNMRTYSFNLDNRPTGNGALCTVTTDGYVTAVSFY